MPGDDQHSAAARRDAGVRRVSQLTWRAGAVGVICSAVIAVAFGHHAEAGTAPPGSSSGTIVVPNQPPTSAPGAPNATSGGS